MNSAFHIGDLGLGDQLCQVGAVRYLSTLYEKVIVVCKKNNKHNMEQVFSDDPNISLYPISHEKDLIPKFGADENKLKEVTSNSDVYMTGCNLPHGGGGPLNYIITKPYEYLNLDFSIFWNYFHIPDFQESKNLHNTIKTTKYAFVHNMCSTGMVYSLNDLSSILPDVGELLLINPEVNMYDKDHEHYELANTFINKNLYTYIDTIKNAEYVICSDSAFFCLAINLEIETPKCFYISRWHNYDHIWSEKYIFNKNKVKRKPFARLTPPTVDATKHLGIGPQVRPALIR